MELTETTKAACKKVALMIGQKSVIETDKVGKSLLATAITDKGVATEPTDTLEQMANNVSEIEGKEKLNCVIFNKGTNREKQIVIPANTTDLSYFFAYQDQANTIDLTSCDTSQARSMTHLFRGLGVTGDFDASSISIENVGNTGIGDMFRNISKATNITIFDITSRISSLYDFFLQSKFESITISTWDLVNVNNVTDFAGQASNWKHIYVKNGGLGIINIKANFNLSAAPLDHDAAMVFIRGLYDFASAGDTSTHKLTFHANTKALLTDDDIALATSKGWTIA